MVRNLLFSFHDLDFLDSQGLDKNLLWVQPGIRFSLATMSSISSPNVS